MIIFGIVAWIIIGVIVVMLTNEGSLAMIAHNFPFLAIALMVLSWILWPLGLWGYFIKEREYKKFLKDNNGK